MNKGNFQGLVSVDGELSALLIRKDGTHRDLGSIGSGVHNRIIGYPVQWWRALWAKLRQYSIIPVTMGFAAFLGTYGVVGHPEAVAELFKDARVMKIVMETGVALGSGLTGLVVQNGANFLATDFASGQASPRISAMNFHDSGTGTVAATSTDTGLGTQAGPATRATGTQSNPATNQYRSVGTINYLSTLAITEWGLFSASTSGTMWDRRVFGAINVISGDSVQYTYTLTISGGGS